MVSETQQGGGEVSAQESESEASEQESLGDNQSEQAAEEEVVECREPVQDILFLLNDDSWQQDSL